METAWALEEIVELLEETTSILPFCKKKQSPTNKAIRSRYSVTWKRTHRQQFASCTVGASLPQTEQCVTSQAPYLCDFFCFPSVKAGMSPHSLGGPGPGSRVMQKALVLPLHGYVAAGKSLSFSGSQFPPPVQ